MKKIHYLKIFLFPILFGWRLSPLFNLRSDKWVVKTHPTNPGTVQMNITFKRGSVGQSEELLIPRSSVQFRLKPEKSNSHGFELHRPSIKKPDFASCPGREVKHLAVYPLGPRLLSFWFVRAKLTLKSLLWRPTCGSSAIHRPPNNSQPISHRLYLTWPLSTPFRLLQLFMFVCLSVGIKPEKLYSASSVGREANPLGVITHGQRHKPRAYQRHLHKHVLVNLWLIPYKLTNNRGPVWSRFPNSRKQRPPACFQTYGGPKFFF